MESEGYGPYTVNAEIIHKSLLLNSYMFQNKGVFDCLQVISMYRQPFSDDFLWNLKFYKIHCETAFILKNTVIYIFGHTAQHYRDIKGNLC